MIDPSALVHPSAIIEAGAIIGERVFIGPFCYIENTVSIAADTVLHSHVVLRGNTVIGVSNEIFQFTSIGEINQDLKYQGEPTRVVIGHRNRIREHVTVHRGTIQGAGVTTIGNDNLLMVNSHIAHDCTIGDRCVFANNATLGGHVQVGDFVVIGGMSAIHQFCIIGPHVLIGGCSGVSQDVPPYIIAQGNHATRYGLNIIGLKRRNFSREEIHTIRQAYRIIYCRELTLIQIKDELSRLAQSAPLVESFITFFNQSQRGIIR